MDEFYFFSGETEEKIKNMLKKFLQITLGSNVSSMVVSNVERKSYEHIRSMCITLCTIINNKNVTIKLKVVSERHIGDNSDTLYAQICIMNKLGNKTKLKPLIIHKVYNGINEGVENYLVCDVDIDYNLNDLNIDIEPFVFDYFISF